MCKKIKLLFCFFVFYVFLSEGQNFVDKFFISLFTAYAEIIFIQLLKLCTITV